MMLLASSQADNVIDWFRDGAQRAASGPIPEQLLVTLRHSIEALALALIIAIPLAVLLAHYRRGEVLAPAVINVGRAIPTVAILGILVLVFIAAGQGFSSGPIVLALTLLALPPLFTNTYAAVRGVDANAVSAARAMGFGERALMAKVELPLSSAVIFTGVRIATVQIIATEPLGAFFGGDGLGVYLRQGLANQDFVQVQAGALLVTATAIGTDLLLYLVGRVVLPRGVRGNAAGRPSRRANPNPTPDKGTIPMRTTRWRLVAALIVPLLLVLAACGSDKNNDSSASGSGSGSGSTPTTTIRLVPQQFNESETLTEVYAQYLKAKGFNVDVQKASGFREIVYPALQNNKADLIIDYTGSAATYLNDKGTPSPDPAKTFDRLKTSIGDKPYQALDYSKAEDKNAMVVLKSFATENHLTKISDLKPIESQVTFGAAAACLTREDCLLGYQSPKFYGLKFKDVKTVDYGPPLAAGLKANTLQAVQYQTTAAEIESGDFVVLDDDKGMLSADNIVPVIRTATVKEFGSDLTKAINDLSAKLTTEDLISWNAKTDIDKDDPADVAKQWLSDKGLI